MVNSAYHSSGTETLTGYGVGGDNLNVYPTTHDPYYGIFNGYCVAALTSNDAWCTR